MVTKKQYEKPAMQVFKLKQQPQLLQTSGNVDATMTTEWEEEDI